MPCAGSPLATQSIIATIETPALGVAKLATADGPSRISGRRSAKLITQNAPNVKYCKLKKTSADRAVL